MQVVIDVRNNYETRIGKFKGAVDPCTTSFREFPSWVEERFQLTRTDADNPKGDVNHSDQSAEKETENPKHLPRVAMYCTGGIRCEKASSLLLSQGFKEVIVILPLNFILFYMNKNYFGCFFCLSKIILLVWNLMPMARPIKHIRNKRILVWFIYFCIVVKCFLLILVSS